MTFKVKPRLPFYIASALYCKQKVRGVTKINIFQNALKRTHDTWFGRAMGLFDRGAIGDDVWDELEELLISADVGVGTTTKLIETVKQRVAEEKLDGSQVAAVLKAEMARILNIPPAEKTESVTPPEVYLVVGVNGSGKTTSIAKLAYQLKKEGKTVLLAAADTFRAAAIDQLKKQGERVGVDVVAHQPGADPGAVVYDAMQAAKSRNADILIIDTAGRLHTKYNLMEELKKVRRVAVKLDATAPHQVILVLDATTGQNGLTQARYFTEAVGVTGVFLAKLDGTAKGGIVLAICDELKVPIQLIGVGEGLEDMVTFNAGEFVEALCS
ncbi:MAG: signal recognition particle-docking protein FtsY [Dehalococcoidales bacterium]|nr:signal recognition particle-docking protein FtsY [Dehalococcoidales bacterium]